MNMTKELSESLLAACREAGIEKPGFIAQDQNGFVHHYHSMPTRIGCEFIGDTYDIFVDRLYHPPYAKDWQDSLLEWVEPQGEPLADVLARHGDLIGDTTEMVILYDVADTSKMIDDACKIAYHAHLEKGDGLCWSRAGDYRQGWQDALAWKEAAMTNKQKP